MRDHSKNIGKKVYFYNQLIDENKIFEGIVVGVDKYDIKIYCEDLDKGLKFDICYFNQVSGKWSGSMSWGYNEKNVKKFFEYKKRKKNKPMINHKYIHFNSNDVLKYSYSKFLEFLKIDFDNPHKNRYDKDLGKFFEYFSIERNYKILDVYENKWDFKTSIDFCIVKKYYDDETKPIGVQILFQYKPFGKSNSDTRMHKFDNFIKTYELKEGEKYNE